jgi:hypothetical protein
MCGHRFLICVGSGAVKKMSESMQLRGTLRGHSSWVTQVTTNSKYPDMMLSASRGMPT